MGSQKVTLMFFLGGVTYAEIAALRFLSQQEDSKLQGMDTVIVYVYVIAYSWANALIQYARTYGGMKSSALYVYPPPDNLHFPGHNCLIPVKYGLSSVRIVRTPGLFVRFFSHTFLVRIKANLTAHSNMII